VRDTPVRELRLRDLACEAGHHPSYVARTFRRTFGLSIGDYARSLRVASVARALSTSKASISAIAHHSGYCEHSHMTHEFARRTGMSPAAWRDATRAGLRA